jgi:hypothetical protein
MDRSTGKEVYRYAGIALIVGAALALSAAIAAATAVAPGWMQANASGFGQPANYHVSALAALDDQLYAGTQNDGGAQVWRAADGVTWSQVMPGWAASNTEVYCATPFGSDLYVGTGNLAGGELWRTDGSTWQQVASAGLGDANNYAFAAAAEFGGALYAATGNLPPAIGFSGDGVEVWRSPSGNAGTWVQVNADGFGAGPTWNDLSMDVFQNHLYVGLSRVTDGGGSLADLWRSGDGTTWTPVFTDGLGYAGNGFVPAMAEFQGQFYITLRNANTGGQLWRSANGLTWTPVFTDGLGATARSRPYGLIVYNNHLVLVFARQDTGSEVWQSSDGLAWQQIASGGWGDSHNAFAGYFDKPLALFRGDLYIGTLNNVAGGEIWRRLHLVHLPLLFKRYVCSGDLSGHIVDATTANPLSNVLVTVDGTALSDMTDASGNYLIPGAPSGARSVTAALDGYVTISQEASIACSTNNLLNFALSPQLPPKEMRIVLTWGEVPRDLDSHLWLPPATPYHICWFQPGHLDAFPFAHLDVDDSSSYGPETITIKQWYPGAYSFAVQKWSADSDLTVSQARVHVYKGADLVATYDVPTSGSGGWWYVFDIDGATQAITTRDYLRVDAPYDPYPCILEGQ